MKFKIEHIQFISPDFRFERLFLLEQTYIFKTSFVARLQGISYIISDK